MFKQLTPLSADQHKTSKVKPIDDFAFAKDFHIASVVVHEVPRAAAVYPVVFIDGQDNEFRPVALLGLEPGKNLFVGQDGKWQASYVPAIIRRYPFALAQSNTEGQFTVCIDEQSALISDNEGNPLFNDAGEPTEIIENVKKYLGELQQMEVTTSNFCQFLKSNNLLSPLNMKLKVGDEVKAITGCYAINVERLNGLNDELFLTLRKNGYMPAVYAQLSSLSQLERLTMLSQGETGMSVEQAQTKH